jgi:hypothetical protein
MAILWDPPVERPSLEPTPAELAWKRWLMEAIVARNEAAEATDEHGESPKEPAVSQ